MTAFLELPVVAVFWDFVRYGLTGWGAGAIVLFTLAATHLTIIGVTVYLHRCQAHRALELHPLISHPLRFWLWMTTGMVTKEWAAIHRKHHAKCETEEDPHSPQTRGIDKVLWQGAELYRVAAADRELVERYGHGTPDDWVERHVYSQHSVLGVSLMLIVNVMLFGVVGAAVWAVQMAWIPFLAAGVINGIGHFWGYRNFKSPDTSTNILPWGILIGGEELHNNHHTFATSPKLSSKWYEFDIGWLYIRSLAALGLAKPRALPAEMFLDPARNQIDADTIEAVISHKYELMAMLSKSFRKHARRAQFQPAVVEKWTELRKEFETMWSLRHLSVEQAVAGLQSWCNRAEASGIAALADFSKRIRMVSPRRTAIAA
jgi:stearoyl-CoA desaturase (delta-9 desaturase)